MTLDPAADLWCFRNSAQVFQSKKYLTERDQELVKSLGFDDDDDWGGSCYGMCVSVILAKNGLFSAQNYTGSEQSVLHDLQPTPQVISMINYYQYSQKSAVFQQFEQYEQFTPCIYRMIRSAGEIAHGGSPFLSCIVSEKDVKHAMVGCGSEQGNWKYCGKNWTDRVLIYDPNAGGIDADRCLYYDADSFAFCIPYYDVEYSGAEPPKSLYFKVCCDMDILNAAPYPFGAPPAAGDADGDGAVSAADAILLMRYLHGETVLDANAWRCCDLFADGRLTAGDLSLLKKQLLRRA